MKKPPRKQGLSCRGFKVANQTDPELGKQEQNITDLKERQPLFFYCRGYCFCDFLGPGGACAFSIFMSSP